MSPDQSTVQSSGERTMPKASQLPKNPSRAKPNAITLASSGLKARAETKAPAGLKSTAKTRVTGSASAINTSTATNEQLAAKQEPMAPKSTIKREAPDAFSSFSSLTTKKRKVSLETDDAFLFDRDDYFTDDLKFIMGLASEVEEMNKELDKPEAKAVLQKLAHRDQLLEGIKKWKEILLR